jgi:peroxygenase
LLIVLGSATYLMLWPEDGRIMKEDVRAIFDGSIFQRIADKVEKKRGKGKQKKLKKNW